MPDTLTDTGRSTNRIATTNTTIPASETSGSVFPEACVKNFSSDRVLINPGVASHGMHVVRVCARVRARARVCVCVCVQSA